MQFMLEQLSITGGLVKFSEVMTWCFLEVTVQ